ncbi:hydrocephalus-inducing protein homolog [Tubulanus polymorphus]|uniref:hydrocephalus-inducing protein homolog n=1 Tax=Tubulanus polymorphus TaxID=672921 RepID=UPI003DA24200
MPAIGPFGEVLGTTGTLSCLGAAAPQFKSKVIAPRNPKLVKTDDDGFKLTPSRYMFQMSLNTEKKLANTHIMKNPKKIELLDMGDTTHQKFSSVPIDDPMFQPFPSEIFFQNYEPFETYEVPFLLRNNDKVPRLVKVTQADSPYFKIVSPHDVGHKVGPGLPTTFRIQFTPEDKKDYSHELVCITEREKFIVPVRCIGSRAILDFPDEVHFAASPVKHSSTKTLLVRNIGNREAKFSLSTDGPFCVSPENGILPVNESMQVTVEFKPMTVGDHGTDLILSYDTGEDIYIGMYGASQDANVRLDKNSIRIENTYISMANQRTVTITNRSDVIAHFQWTPYATQEEEDMQKSDFYKDLETAEDVETKRFLEECEWNPSLKDKLSLLTRTFMNKRKRVTDDKMVFNDDVFKLDPIEGDIWPNSSLEVNVIFKPGEAITYNNTVFCNITGRESRLPLRIRGDGIGPKVQFSFEELDMGNVFVNSMHTYEVVLANKGDIDAIFNVIIPKTIFGPKFSFNPPEGIVMPEGHQAILVTFSSEILGDFEEEFEFQIDGAPQRSKVKFSGSVIGPTFHFDVPKLKFGMISFGFQYKESCVLSNTSLVPMTFSLRIPGDGLNAAISSHSETDVRKRVSNPKEFTITPDKGMLSPRSSQNIEIELVSNSIRKYDLALVVDVAGVGKEILTLPIQARCVVPSINILTPILDYGRCFLNHEYENSIRLSNDTDLPAKYEILPQDLDALSPITYFSPQPIGVIKAHSILDVPVLIAAHGLEELDVMSHVQIFGSPEPPMAVHISCIGEGPVVHITPENLDWGVIPVLADTPQTIVLSNESLIAAKFTAHMLRPYSVWTVEPRDGEIPAEKTAILTVTANLNDCVRFHDKLQINILDSQSRTIDVTAYGQGTTIVSEPDFGPVLDLGPHFGSTACRRTFKMTNNGRRHQQLVWSTEGFTMVRSKKDPVPPNVKDIKFKNKPPLAALPQPIFTLTPSRMDMAPGETIEAVLEGIVDHPQSVKERMICHAIIGRSGGKELIKKVDIKVDFITPLLEFSSKQLFFRIDKKPHDELVVQTRDVLLKNVSSLPLTAQFQLSYPFQLLMQDGTECSKMELVMDRGQELNLRVQFDPAYKNDSHIRTIDEVLAINYKEHPHVDYIALRGEVYFPNLEFEKQVIDFGCILNDTEVTRYVNIMNNSPMDVKYKWSFLIGDEPIAVRQSPIIMDEPPAVQLLEISNGDVEDLPPPEEPSQAVTIEKMVTISTEDNVFTDKVDDQVEISPPASQELMEKSSRRSSEVSQPEITLDLDGLDDSKEKQDSEKDVDEKNEDELRDETIGEGEGELIKTSRSVSGQIVTPRPASSASKRPEINPILEQLLEQDRDLISPLGVEEVFDILPLYGHLAPGDTEQVTLTFFGHADIWSKAKAICEVEGGPTYEIDLKGEASLVEYRFDCTDIDYEKQMYDEVASAEITLINCGKVGFNFTALGIDPEEVGKPRPGIPVMIPHSGYIEALSQQTLTIKFLPGVPERFHKSFMIQVAHFEPDIVNLYGEGVFTRISLDLPRIGDEEGLYSSLLKEAREVLSKDVKNIEKERDDQNQSYRSVGHSNEDVQVPHEHLPSELEIQMEVERMMVKEFTAEQNQKELSHVDTLVITDDEQQKFDQENQKETKSKKSKKKTKPKPRLADYLLDFGYVVLGTVRAHIVRATNTGFCPVSFSVDRAALHHHGFNVELDRVRQLPGAPDHETVDFVVSFDPRGANLPLGPIETVVPINIVNGPQICIRLRAHVTMPDMEISTDALDFGDVKCGDCKVITVQLHNHKYVRCEWSSIVVEKNKKKVDRTMPMHLRRKIKAEPPKPKMFEMMPPAGSLMPGQRINVQVKFMPTEEKFYEHRMPIRIAQSSQRILMIARGQGLEPRLDFDRNLVHFGPILPHSVGDEQDITVRNPCPFPIEFYNLEFDRLYLEEEKILRLMKGYDEYNTILLPPRAAGDKLPQELLDFYDEQMKKLEEIENSRREAEEAAEQARKEMEEHAREIDEMTDAAPSTLHVEDDQMDAAGGPPQLIMTAPTREPTAEPAAIPLASDKDLRIDDIDDGLPKDSASSIGVGELEITPVSASIARHLGIDLSPEGKAARNRRGIAIIVQGAPMSGKTATAVILAKRYEAALLSVDGIILEAIANGATPAGLRAREMCAEASRRAEEMKVLEGDEGDKRAPGGLSVEALTAHTQGQSKLAGLQPNAAHSMVQSMASNRKTSVISEQKSKDKHHGSSVITGAKTGMNQASSAEGGTGSQVPSSPPPLVAPIARRLSISASITGENGLMSCILPEDLLVELLAERLQLNDCHRGVVFDSLETLFSANMLSTAHAILKALNNRKYIFSITLKLDYNTLKEREKREKEEKERLAKEKEDEERKKLEEMSEDEYDALDEEEKASVDKKRLEIKKERIRKEMEEKMERERIEREAMEAEMRRLEEEKQNKRRGRKGAEGKEKDGKDAKKGSKPSQDKVAQPKGKDAKGHEEHIAKTASNLERPESHQTEKSDEEGKKKKHSKDVTRDGKRPISNEASKESQGQLTQDEIVRDPIREAELLLMQKFRTFEYGQKEIPELLYAWDRSTGQLHRPVTPSEKSENVEDINHPPSGKKGKSKADKEKHEKEKEKERERLRELEREKAEREKAAREIEGDMDDGECPIGSTTDRDDGIGIPNIMIDCNQLDIEKSPDERVFETRKLPTPAEVLDGLGLGPTGPPIPPPASFAVIPYPVKRRQPNGGETNGHYVFIASSPDDPNVITDDKSKEGDDESITPDRKEEHTPTRGRKDKLKPDGAKERKKSAGRKPRRNSLTVQGSPPPGPATPVSDVDGQSVASSTLDTLLENRGAKLGLFRWIIPANSEVVLRLRFQSEDLGQFDQTMNFEIMGTRRRYQLFCRGVCSFPTISREPRIIFPQRKKNKKSEDIVHKKYILTTEVFEFGPLLIGKSREKYKEGKYPENMETFTILNTSPLEADINFCFLNDSKGETYLLDPPNMILKPSESAGLCVWAYPKAPGAFEDAIVCCVRENPEPIIFKISAHGVRPEIELDKKQLHFERVLLHRKDTKTVYLRNSTLLPVAWKVSGMESLGDDFSVAAESGIIEPKSEYALNAHFRAMKPITTSKKSIRLEVSDVENIMGLVQTENIQVIAEAYDIALDMSFPKGADAGIDFGTIRVLEETKQTCSMKNKGKYEIAYNFILENPDPNGPDVNSLFSIIPQRGTLSPVDRPSGTQVQILFKAKEEVVIRDAPILRCQVIEPNLSDGGETIASIPVKVSVKAVFSKYNIVPIEDISFGSLVVNSKKTRTFIIENKGEFDFRYTIHKFMKMAEQQLQAQKPRPPVKQNDKRTKSRDGSSSGRSTQKQPKRAESIRQETIGGGGGQARLVLGMFTIFPAFGSIQPNQSQTITVDCVAETPGKCEEEIVIDISDRDPKDHKDGIPYKLFAEACLPSINIGDVGSIFEEHRVCKNLSIWQHSHQIESGGVYGEDENRFVFNNVIVGCKAKARFKIANSSKVPCDVVFSIKPVQGKHMPKQQDIFEIEPTRAQVIAHGHAYATVTFCPPSMQAFTAVFEAALEGLPQSLRGKNLTFEVHGEGNLPRISIQKPTVRNRKGQPLALFRKNLVGRSESLPLVLVNDGTLPCKVDIDLADPDGAFSMKPINGTKAIMNTEDKIDGISKKPHTASVIIDVDETASFDMIFKPLLPQRSQANVKISVVNNQYEDSIVQLVGEGYEDDVTFDNIPNINFQIDPEKQEGNMADDDVEAAKANHIHFGDCYIKEPRVMSFTLTNHSKEDCIRFVWPEIPELKYSPQIGHLHAGCSKDIAVTFKSDEVKTLEEHPVPCKLTKITFDKPVNEVADWDDRMRIVKWVDIAPPATASADGSKTPGSATTRPAKKKVVETEVEPVFNEIGESSRTMDLLVSANADYCQYKCKTESITFKDTLMFQTRVYEFALSNKGTGQMEYNWKVIMEDIPSHSQSSSVTDDTMSIAPSMQDVSSSMSIVSDTGCLPFTVDPISGMLAAGKKQSFTVKFSPINVQDYDARLMCTIPNLEEGQQGPVIGLHGRSLLPYCHFELEDSDYISGARRNPELRGPNGSPPGAMLDPNTRVIEFEAIGVGVRTVRRFNIINPTNQPYSYVWINEDDPDPKIVSSFKGLTMEGAVLSGKKHEIAFEFMPNQLGIVESFWRFVIPEQSISIPFVLVGETKEPRVTLDRSHFNYKSLLIGHEALETVHVINNEDTSFHFAFVERTCFSAGHASHITVEPMNGIVPPKSMFPINLYFTPTTDNEVNFNLICNVKRKTQHLSLNVKAEGYTMSSLLMCEDSQGNKIELDQYGFNEINFGEVEINESSTRNLYVINNGKFNFDFKWELNERNGKRQSMVTIDPVEHAVNKGEREKCILSFCPTSKASLKGCELKLKVSNGPTYNMAVLGHGVSPGLHFTFQSYNFGPCFVYRAGMPTPTAVLQLMNRDKKEISVDCLYQSTSYLTHDFEAMVIAPGQSVPIRFTFFPREPIRYHEVIEFEVNGLSKQVVEIFGQGTEMKIEVVNPKQKIVNFGALRLGQMVKKQIPVVNNSPAALTFNLAVTPSQQALQQAGVLTVYPTNEITLEPKGGTRRIDVTFAPKTRIPQFTEEVVLECAGMFQPLFIMKGSCQGIEISLDMESIPFGAVVQNSRSTRKLLMINTGDIGARFKWDVAKFGPDFSIEPVEGYISPGMEVPFEVHFHPKDLNQDVRYDNLKCNIEGGKPLKLTLTGMCISVSPVKEIQHFTTHVRNRETKNLMIMNRTNQCWNLRPVIDGEFYSGPETFTVDPQQTKSYELVYYPMVMTAEGKKHLGTVFFPLPDGTGLLYNVQGTAEPPKPNSRINRDIPCKTSYTELLSVNNWLKKPQRFKVRFEMMKPDKLDLGTTLKGLDYIDVPGNNNKDYRLNYYAHKEGQSQFKVVFTNESTGEYQFYEITFKSVRPGVISTVNLSTPVRQSVQNIILLENPLTQAVTFNATCPVTEILMPTQLQVPAQSEGAFNMEYLPLKVGESQARLEFNSNELGLYMYDLNLKATAAGPEKAIYFRTNLGSSQTQMAKFLNFAKLKTDYTCKVDNSDFHVDKSVAAAPGSSTGTEVGIEVNFEPSKLGEVRATLTVSSNSGGEYVFPLYGTCIAPKPQGPYVIKAGSNTSITFRNVFPHTTAFTFQVDNPAFHLAKTGDNIRAHKDNRIVVGFDGADSGAKGAVMGKLTVTCAKSAGGPSSVQWVYYLKGVTL